MPLEAWALLTEVLTGAGGIIHWILLLLDDDSLALFGDANSLAHCE